MGLAIAFYIMTSKLAPGSAWTPVFALLYPVLRLPVQGYGLMFVCALAVNGAYYVLVYSMSRRGCIAYWSFQRCGTSDRPPWWALLVSCL